MWRYNLKDETNSFKAPVDDLQSAVHVSKTRTRTSTPNDILHDSAARAKYTRTHDQVCPTTIIAVIGQMGERAQFYWQAGSVHMQPIKPGTPGWTPSLFDIECTGFLFVA